MVHSAFLKKILSKIYRVLIPIKAYQIRQKQVINVVFVFSRVSMWKNDHLYREMSNHRRFNPMIAIVPDIMLNADLEDIIDECETFLKEKNYNYINPFIQDSSVSSLRQLHPDIIFYSRPYNAYPEGFRYEENYGSLFCYSHYGHHTIKESHIVDTRFINHVWQNYYENSDLMEETLQLWPHLKNIRVTGLPNTDSFWHNVESQWKSYPDAQCRIIWAPHFSVEAGWLNYSNFLDIAEDFLKFAKANKSLQFAFKPHPLLKSSLYKHPDWGRDKTDEYYHEWATFDNCQLVEGDYIGLFMYSDAMIHDCSSFLVEYLHANKPVMFLMKDECIIDGLFQFGLKALGCHYKGKDMNDIEKFISNVVINGQDPKKAEREVFIKDYLMPPNGKTASQNIINAILGE